MSPDTPRPDPREGSRAEVSDRCYLIFVDRFTLSLRAWLASP